MDDLLRAWQANDAVNLELLDLCPDDTFELKPGKGKTIRSNFVHIIANRRFHLEEKMRKEAALIPKLDWKSATREEIRDALRLTHEMTAELLGKLDVSMKQTRWTAPLFLVYSVAHEAHHRSQIEITLRLHDREPDEMALYNLWNWPKKV